jgi:hypothetical protein
MLDTEWLESRLVKGNRAMEVLDGYENVVEHEFLFADYKVRATLNMGNPRGISGGVCCWACLFWGPLGPFKR